MHVVQRAFKPGRFDKWKCVHYDETADPAFCHVCAKAGEVEGELKGFCLPTRKMIMYLALLHVSV